jgi:5-methylthioadenosine/S-adenosylhomocysteine deaminase
MPGVTSSDQSTAGSFRSSAVSRMPPPAQMIDGDLAYGRADWMTDLVADSDQGRLEALIAWGKPVLLDTSYTAEASDEQEPPLAQLRADLIKEYPPVGPIFA